MKQNEIEKHIGRELRDVAGRLRGIYGLSNEQFIRLLDTPAMCECVLAWSKLIVEAEQCQ